jgi:hypothetical protein
VKVFNDYVSIELFFLAKMVNTCVLNSRERIDGFEEHTLGPVLVTDGVGGLPAFNKRFATVS